MTAAGQDRGAGVLSSTVDEGRERQVSGAAPELEVVIVSYNCAELLRRCLESLRANVTGALRTVVHVVDNGSVDGTPELVALEFPEVRLHLRPDNPGFAVANNVALRQVVAPYVLVLNPDTEVLPGVVQHVVGVLDGDPGLGVVGCRLVREDGTFDHAAKRSFPTVRSAAAHLLRPAGRGRRSSYTVPELDEHDAGGVDAVNGAFMLVRTAAMHEVGLFDERYWMYGEDLDWCRRFHRDGWGVRYDGRVTAVHLKGAVAGKHRGLHLNWHFHKSMAIFYRTYEAGQNRLVDGLVYAAIGARFALTSVRSAVASRLGARRPVARRRPTLPTRTGASDDRGDVAASGPSDVRGGAPVRVDLVLRQDAATKPGGDVVQARAYADELRALGVDVRAEPFRPGLEPRAGAVVHYFNLGRPYELLALARTVPVERMVVSTIHQSRAAVRSLRRVERSWSVRGVLAGMPTPARELVLFVLRTLRGGAPVRATVAAVAGAARDSVALSRNVRRVLDRCRAVTLLSAREAEALRRDVHWSGANGVVVPNGVPESPVEPLPAWQDRDPRILVVGRIEPGKRSTDILETAERLGVPVTFVGACNPAAREYGERFASAVRDAQHATWLGARERTEVLDLMAHSRVLLNFSWVEVQSLVDIEAAMQGCWVVACSNGSSAEHLGGHVVELPEDRIVDAVRAAAARARSDAGPGTPSYGATWRGAARALLDVYSGPT